MHDERFLRSQKFEPENRDVICGACGSPLMLLDTHTGKCIDAECGAVNEIKRGQFTSRLTGEVVEMEITRPLF